MSYRWRYLNSDGAQVEGPAESFADQESAEDWLGQHWAELRDAGVDAVTLLDGATELYGPMSLYEQ